ncbi:cysteine/glutathione ABC transporter permease/ATP-binding protein CydD [Pseudaeromonas sharmana]|uniref:Cysteine/glutathione ABC transporter permease/ATP-binding protein CydD n=1 Tax=Pseudaeromonas sharmana TaxID=328412 RepID=A0ABV8CSF5_9GAMM
MDKQRQTLLLRWLRQHASLGRPWAGLILLCGACSGGLLIAQAWWLASLLQQLIIREQPLVSLWPELGVLALLIVLRGLLNLLREQAAFRAGTAIRCHLRRRLADEMTRRGPAYLQQQPAGSWASLLQEQVENLQDFYARYLPQTRLCAIQPLLILFAVFPVNWAAGLILLGTAPLIPLFMILTGLGAADANRRNFEALRRLSGHFLDRLRGMATLRHYQASDRERVVIAKASEEFRERTMDVLRMAFLSSAVLEFFASVAIALIAVYFGFSYLEHLNFGDYGSKVTLFTGLFVLLLAPDFYLPLRELGAHYHAKAQALGAADEIEHFLQQPWQGATAGSVIQERHTAPTIQARALEVLSPQGDVLVGPLDFTLVAGSLTAIIGRSGAGKSSLLAALLGFLPYRGSLTVEGTELSQLEMTHWRRKLAWLGQNPRLLHGSLRDNLRLGHDYDDAVLEQAMQQAGAADILASKGWDYVLGDGASGLSVGQAQRLALARTLLQPAQVWLLDEPTASLDRDNEARILAALEPQLQGKTSLLVTHRLNQLQRVDQVLLIEQGKLVAAGDPRQLAQQPGPLRDLLSQAPQPLRTSEV